MVCRWRFGVTPAGDQRHSDDVITDLVITETDQSFRVAFSSRFSGVACECYLPTAFCLTDLRMEYRSRVWNIRFLG